MDANEMEDAMRAFIWIAWFLSGSFHPGDTSRESHSLPLIREGSAIEQKYYPEVALPNPMLNPRLSEACCQSWPSGKCHNCMNEPWINLDVIKCVWPNCPAGWGHWFCSHHFWSHRHWDE